MNKIAICMSGHLRSFELCLPSINEFILNRDCDIFGYIADEDDLSNQIYLINFTKLIIERQKPLPEFNYSPQHVKTVQGTLQQLYGLYRVDQLRCAHEQACGEKYDWVIRLRPDLIIKTPLEDLNQCDKDAIYIPSELHDHGGYNDRFAFGNSLTMKIYMQRYYLMGFNNGTYQDIFHPESSLQIALNRANIPIKRTPIKYAFCRKDGRREAELF